MLLSETAKEMTCIKLPIFMPIYCTHFGVHILPEERTKFLFQSRLFTSFIQFSLHKNKVFAKDQVQNRKKREKHSGLF